MDLRAFSSGVPNAKYLTFGTPNTNKTSLMRCSKSQKIWHTWIVRSQIWKRTERCVIILMNFLFFSLSCLCQSLPPFFLKHRSVLSYFLIPSYFLPHHQFPSMPTHTPNPTPTHQFHANANANANASLPRRSLSSCGFYFSFSFFLFLVVVSWVGWAMGGFGWTDR